MLETKPTSKGRTKAPAAGGGSAGTTASAAATKPAQLATEDARERELMIAESLAPAGGSVTDIMADAPAAPSGNAADPVLTGLIVRALPPTGFRRAGRHWGPEPVEVAADDFTVEQINALLDEPLLHVTLIGEAE